MTPQETGFGADELLVAAALAGDREALAALAQRDADGALARRHRVGAALYLRTETAELAAPGESWHEDLCRAAARMMIFEREHAKIGAVLAAAGVTWAPIKGIDLAFRVYAAPEERMLSDLDLLIGIADLEAAREALLAAGWRDLAVGPRDRRFLVEEGYAWRAVGVSGALLELHFRLWGAVPEALSAALLDAALEDPESGGCRLRLADAYVLAAIHAWLDPPPRSPVRFFDLERIAARLEERDASAAAAARVSAVARRFDLQWLVLQAARISAALWGRKLCRRVAEELADDLRWPERWLESRTARGGVAGLSLGAIQAARLLSGRRMRMGTRAAWRRLWPHAGIVERGTPPEWPWWRRRWWYQLQRRHG